MKRAENRLLFFLNFTNTPRVVIINKFNAMDIAIIGTGKVGTALALGLAELDHRIIFGSRDPLAQRVQNLCHHEYISAASIEEAAELGNLIILAVPANALNTTLPKLGDITSKVCIDATNGIFSDLIKDSSSLITIKKLTASQHVVKCFKSVGYKLLNPRQTNPQHPTNMFMAGDCELSKEFARRLSEDLGFAHCFDVGDDTQAANLEAMAAVWVNIARSYPKIGNSGWCFSPNKVN